MKALLLFCSTLFVAGMVQEPATPPMKMGLWESTNVVKMTITGAQAPNIPAHTTKTHACYTPESWTAGIGVMNNGCTRTHEKFSDGHFSADLSCGKDGVLKGHLEGAWPTMDVGQGTEHMESNTGGMRIASDATFHAHFLSSDCGSLAAGKIETVK